MSSLLPAIFAAPPAGAVSSTAGTGRAAGSLSGTEKGFVSVLARVLAPSKSATAEEEVQQVAGEGSEAGDEVASGEGEGAGGEHDVTGTSSEAPVAGASLVAPGPQGLPTGARSDATDGPSESTSSGGASASTTLASRAASASIAEAGEVTASSPTSVQRGLEKLAPEFRSRLERVLERMRDEHGHEVTVTETLRSEERQEFLFAQGRSRPGPVVTWTRSSQHSLGLAADVMVDGSYDNPEGYAHLANLAAEEGLRTLGPMDPGHVELLEVSPVEAKGSSSGGDDAGRYPGGRGVAQVAEVARVAEVAVPARPAEVATVASVVGSARTKRQESSDAGSGKSQSSEGIVDGSGSARPEAASEVRLPPSLSRTEALTGTAGMEAASRVARVLEIREGASTAPLNQVVLRLDNASGGEDRIRVQLRGNAVGTTIDLANSQEVERLQERLPELQRALERQGLETEALRVRQAGPASVWRELIETSGVRGFADAGAHRGAAGERDGQEYSSARQREKEMPHDGSQKGSEDSRRQSSRQDKGDRK